MRILLTYICVMMASEAFSAEVVLVEPPFASKKEVRASDLQGTWTVGFQGMTFEVIAKYKNASSIDVNHVDWLNLSIKSDQFNKTASKKRPNNHGGFPGRVLVYRVKGKLYVVIGRFFGSFPRSVNDVFLISVYCIFRVEKVDSGLELHDLNADSMPGICKALGIEYLVMSKSYVVISCDEEKFERLIEYRSAFKKFVTLKRTRGARKELRQ